MKTTSILFSVNKKIFKYSSKNDTYEWELEFDYRVYGISRIDNHVFVTTYSNWGKQFTNLVDFNTGKLLWTMNEIFYSVHIVDEVLIYVNKKKYFTGINLKTGEGIFSVKSPIKFTTGKSILLNGKFYIYSSRKTFLLDIKNGKTSESKLPYKLNPKEMGIVLDEFQININNLPSAGGDASYAFIGDAGGGDAGGGDAGGGD